MKSRNLAKFVAVAATAAVVLFAAGCGKPEGHAGGDAQGHAEHKHGGKATAICAAHNVPKELCFICDANLRDKGRLWCEEHADAVDAVLQDRRTAI